MSDVIFNLIVIRSANVEKAIAFYQTLGLEFSKHRHGSNGVEHFASQAGQIVFEIYPQKNPTESTINTRLGFQVNDVGSLVTKLQDRNISIIVKPKESEWGLRAVVADPDGHRIELIQS